MAKWPADWAPGRYFAGLADAAMFKIYIYIYIYIYICRV
jgi:hypothetical protein